MKLLNNEKIIISSNNNIFALTNYRVVLESVLLGETYRNIIFLEDISSVESIYKSRIIYLILAALSVIFGMYHDSFLGGVLLAIIFLGLWWVNRKRIIVIKPNGGKSIEILLSNVGKDDAPELIHQISQAKLDRINYLHSKDNIKTDDQ